VAVAWRSAPVALAPVSAATLAPDAGAVMLVPPRAHRRSSAKRWVDLRRRPLLRPPDGRFHDPRTRL